MDIEPVSSSEAFSVMERFALTLPDKEMQNLLDSGDEKTFTCKMEISSCYPALWGLQSYHRTFTYDGHFFTVQDTWKANSPMKATLTLFHETPDQPVMCDLPRTNEPYPIEDAWLKERWGNMLYRTIFSAPETAEGTVTLRFSV